MAGVLCAQEPGLCCPGGSSESRMSVFSQLRTALPFPSLAQLCREHQVQQQGHRPTAFPMRLTPAGWGWRGGKPVYPSRKADKPEHRGRCNCFGYCRWLHQCRDWFTVSAFNAGRKNQLSNLLLHNFCSWLCPSQPWFPKVQDDAGTHENGRLNPPDKEPKRGCSPVTKLGGFGVQKNPEENESHS